MRLALTTLLSICACLGGGVADADPELGYVLSAPTAWLPPSGAVVGSAGLDLPPITRHGRADGDLSFALGIGGIASLELDADREIHGCEACTGAPPPMWLARAAFKLGAPQDAWFPGMPAIALGVRTTIGSYGELPRVRVSTAYLVASRVIGPVKLHGGVSVIAASTGDVETDNVVKPFGAFELTPPATPKSTLIADISYIPTFAGDTARAGWIFGAGVRYQALRWGSIDLAVQHREGESSDEASVVVRVHGVFNAPAQKRP